MSFHSNRTHGFFWGFVLILIGLLFLFDQYDWLDIGELWPLAIIAVGIWMIIKPRHRFEKENWGDKGFGDRTYITDVDNVIQSNTFGDINVTINSKDFKAERFARPLAQLK